MAALHSLLLLRQIRHDTKPAYLYNRIRKDFQYETRLASNAGIPQHMTFRTEYARNSFINRIIRLWNELPPEIRLCQTQIRFRTLAAAWVKANVNI